MFRKAFLAASAVFAVLPAIPASAAGQLVNSDGLLTGATGVNVDGSLYNVEFLDGTCASVFGTCATFSFAFQTQATAQLAAQALLDQVLLGVYDDKVTLTLGCPSVSSLSGCLIGIPYLATATTYDTAFTQNRSNSVEAGGRRDCSTVRVINQTHSYSTTSRGGEVFARFTFTGLAPAAVPEPTSWAMMISGFGLVGGAARLARKKQTMLAAA